MEIIAIDPFRLDIANGVGKFSKHEVPIIEEVLNGRLLFTLLQPHP